MEDDQNGSIVSALEGVFLDLFQKDLPVLESVPFAPGETCFLYDLAKAPAEPCVLAAAGRVESETWNGHSGCITVTCPQGVRGQLVIRLPARPAWVMLQTSLETGEESPAEWRWDAAHGLVRIGYEGRPTGVKFTLEW
jgi:hypothetical protein